MNASSPLSPSGRHADPVAGSMTSKGIEVVLPDVRAPSLVLDSLSQTLGPSIREAVSCRPRACRVLFDLSRMAWSHGSAPRCRSSSGDVRESITLLTELVRDGQHIGRRHRNDQKSGRKSADELRHSAQSCRPTPEGDTAGASRRAVVRAEPPVESRNHRRYGCSCRPRRRSQFCAPGVSPGIGYAP